MVFFLKISSGVPETQKFVTALKLQEILNQSDRYEQNLPCLRNLESTCTASLSRACADSLSLCERMMVEKQPVIAEGYLPTVPRWEE